MRIIKIQFENINSLKGKWKIDFTEPSYKQNHDIFVICGETGSGKSDGTESKEKPWKNYSDLEEDKKHQRLSGLHEGFRQGNQAEIQQGKNAEIPEIHPWHAGTWHEVRLQGAYIQEGGREENLRPVRHSDKTILVRMEN